MLHFKPRHCPSFIRPKRRCLDVHALVSLVDGSDDNANEGRDGCRGNVVVAIQELTGTLLLMQTGVVESGARTKMVVWRVLIGRIIRVVWRTVIR